MNPIFAAALEVERVVKAAGFRGQPRMTADVDLTA